MPQPTIAEILLQTFAAESEDLVARLRRRVIQLEHEVGAEREASLQTIWRDLHTLKGSASAVGLDTVAAVGHALEDLFDALGPLDGVPEAASDVVLQALDWIEEGPTAGADPAASSALCRSVDEVRGALQDGPQQAPVTPPPEPPEPPEPPALPATPEPPPPAAEPAPRPAPAPPAKAPRLSTLRVDPARVEGLQTSVGDLVVATLQCREAGDSASTLSEELDGLLQQWRKLQGGVREIRDRDRTSAWARLEERLAGFTTELADVQRRVYRLSGQLQRQTVDVERVADELQGGLRTMSLSPVKPMLEGFSPVVRDAARATGRRARLVLGQADTEVDRAVLERLREPLLHLVRNAVAHGVEDPEHRRTHGKRETGTVRLSAVPEGELVVFSVADDGGGIDLGVVQHKARAAGLLAEGEAVDASNLLDILTSPGFSTAQEVNSVAGRGVGMDVVRETVQALGGTMRLDTVPGAGSTFRLRVPARITRTRGLVVECGPYRFGVPLRDVERIVRIGPDDVEELRGTEVVRVAGAPVAVAGLAELLGDPAPRPTEGRRQPTIVLRSGELRAAVLVDDIPGEIPLVIKPLGEQFQGQPQFAGCAVEGDGSALLVLDPPELLRRMRGQSARRRLASPGPARDGEATEVSLRETRPTTILVAEDSITMRTLERNILETAGYQVIAVPDGQAAFEFLSAGGSCDLIVTDVNMPRMDGFELCRQVRRSISEELPIVVVTSMGGAEDKRRGVEVGADAFVVKGRFEQSHFLGTIHRLVS
jgi:chemotaxis protein histidine kinase CheA